MDKDNVIEKRAGFTPGEWMAGWVGTKPHGSAVVWLGENTNNRIEVIETMNKDKTKEKRGGFTQGPWTSEDCTPGESAGLCYAIKSEHTVIARTTDGWKEAQANARLIASAPELYEQCKFLEKILEHTDHHSSPKLAQLREVLAKADGGAEG